MLKDFIQTSQCWINISMFMTPYCILNQSVRLNIMSNKGVWITWENQRRNKGISLELGFQLCEIICSNTRVIRYLTSLLKTTFILIKEKPDIVVAQNPSVILAFFVVLLKHVFHYKCLIDAHNAGLFPCDNKVKILNICSKTIQKLADITIVTNNQLADIVKNNGGSAIVLPDRIPVPPVTIRVRKLTGTTNIAFICSFSSDEPFYEVIEAAKHLPKDVFIYITGKHIGKVDPNDLSSNVIMVGFIPDNEYWDLISSADGIMVLTTRENCLVCGAYEALSVNKPMILSKTDAIVDYFRLGSIYTNPTSDEILRSIMLFIANKHILSQEVETLKNRLNHDWNEKYYDLSSAIDRLFNGGIS